MKPLSSIWPSLTPPLPTPAPVAVSAATLPQSLRPFNRRAWLTNSVLAATALGLQGRLSASNARPLRVGQIGVQHAHATKLSVYRQLPEYEVVGIAESDPTARAAAEGLPAFKGVPWMSEAELLDKADLDVVLVETHVRDLLATAQRAIDRGLHVHLDKPAGHDLDSYKRLLESARQKQLMVQMGYMYRYNPAVILLREFLSQNWLGEIYEVHAMLGKLIPANDRRELAEFPGGVMFELGCHLIDLVVGVIGADSRPTVFHQHLGGDGLSDNTLMVLEKPRLLATVKVSAYEVEGTTRRHLTVCGTRGTFHIQPLDNPTATITLDEPRGQFKAGIQTRTFPRFTRYIADAVDMARIIAGQKACDFSYEHDLDVQRLVLASG